MALIDGKGIIIGARIASGITHDSQLCLPTVDETRNHVRFKNKFCLHADKAFDSAHIRLTLASYGGYAAIPPRRHGYTATYKPGKDSRRWKVERTHA